MAWPSDVSDLCGYIRDTLLPDVEKWIEAEIRFATGYDQCFQEVFCKIEKDLMETVKPPDVTECQELQACFALNLCDQAPQKPIWPFQVESTPFGEKKDHCPDNSSLFCTGTQKWMTDFSRWVLYEVSELHSKDLCSREAICNAGLLYKETSAICIALDTCLGQIGFGEGSPRIAIPTGPCKDAADAVRKMDRYFKSLKEFVKKVFEELEQAQHCIQEATKSLSEESDEFMRKCLESKGVRGRPSEPDWPWK